jgi:3-oxoacyl-(acyl-carrier-protein) synthase
MEIPESISELTTTVQPNSLHIQTVEDSIDTNTILNTLKRCITVSDYTNLEEGLAFYRKDTQSDKNFIKNFLALYLDVTKRALLDSNITDDQKQVIANSLSITIQSISNNIDAIYDIAYSLNKQKNILDVRRISFIMVGYAIAIIKKIYNN